MCVKAAAILNNYEIIIIYSWPIIHIQVGPGREPWTSDMQGNTNIRHTSEGCDTTLMNIHPT